MEKDFYEELGLERNIHRQFIMHRDGFHDEEWSVEVWEKGWYVCLCTEGDVWTVYFNADNTLDDNAEEDLATVCDTYLDCPRTALHVLFRIFDTMTLKERNDW